MSLVDLKLDDTHDVDFSSGGKLNTQGSEALGQKIKVALLLRTGEWPQNVSKGIPYSTVILGGKDNKDFVDTFMQSYIIAIEGVNRLVSYSSEVDANRKMSITFSATSVDDGDEIETLVEV